MPKQTETCELCGKTFEAWPSQKRRFCSRSCQGVVNGRVAWGRRVVRPGRPRLGETVPCMECGTLVYRGPAEAAKRTARYCSKACVDRARCKPPVIKACAVCGKEMRLKPSQAVLQCCSMDCRDRLRTKRPGDRLHNGKPIRYDRQGYVMVYEPNHPNKAFHGWQYEHRLVAEQTLGRYLRSDEHVHHLDGQKDRNDPDNLEVMDGLAHATLSLREYQEQVRGERAELEAARAELEEYRRRYGPLEDKD